MSDSYNLFNAWLRWAFSFISLAGQERALRLSQSYPPGGRVLWWCGPTTTWALRMLSSKDGEKEDGMG